ncbi:hypothetical protein NQZ68_034363 [Dissostichus eleginoides]|nr:hypothetical protein NQZ68_034363 [Dissostichus eleginoides]
MEWQHLQESVDSSEAQDQAKSADFLAHEKVRRVEPPGLSRGSTGSIASLGKRTDNSWARARASAGSLMTVILARPKARGRNCDSYPWVKVKITQGPEVQTAQ